MGIIAEKMLAAGILTHEGRDVLKEESSKVRKLLRKTAWEISILRERPILFERVKDKNGVPMRIVLSADKIKVEQEHEDKPPFSVLDVSILMEDLAGNPIGKWHLDRANGGQSGPLFHLQFGGHHPAFRDREFPVKEPRWCHPPMELALLCEMISANFFEAKWAEFLRDDPAWCGAIRIFQELCYQAYAKRLSESLNASHSTALGKMWNDRWI
ncbi:hypothetical protein D3C72_985990 [compost metagenome]